jgi:dTDP-4-dehydrorhamnose reductase
MISLGTKKDVLKVVSDQIGTPTYAGDLAAAIEAMITSDKKLSGIYHFSNLGVASWYDFAQAIFEYTEITCKVDAIGTKQYPTPAIRPKFSVLDKSRIINELGIEIPYWRDSLKMLIKRMGIE